MFESQFARRYVAAQVARPQARADSTFWNITRAENSAEISIYDEIGYWGTTAAEFLSEIAALDVAEITLRLNSPGGDVFDAFAIYNALQRHPATVNVVVDGLAASAASFIAMAGDSIKMSRHSHMMIHEAWGVSIGPAADLRKAADMLDSVTNDIAEIYAERSGTPSAVWRARMAAETWFSDQEAVDAGLADEVLNLKAPRNSFDLSMFVRTPVELRQTTANSAARTNQESKPPPVDALRHEQLLAVADADAVVMEAALAHED